MRKTLICCALLGVFSSSNAVIFKLSNVVCVSFDQSWFQYHECRLKAISREKVILNINGTFPRSVNNVFVHVNLYKRESGFKPWLLKARVDACRYMRKRYNPIVNIIYGLFKEFTNINHTCPYLGPILIRGFYLKPELLPLPFPSGEYMLSLKWFSDRKLQSDTNVSFLFVEDLMNT